jgi:hypothetical protein
MTNPLPNDTVFEMLEEGVLYRLPDGTIVQAYRHDDEGLVWGLRNMLDGDGYNNWYAIDTPGHAGALVALLRGSSWRLPGRAVRG